MSRKRRTNRNRLIALFALIGWLVLLLFSGNLKAQQPAESPTKLKIGLLIPSQAHQEAVYGAQFAVDKINAEGGIHGAQVELLVRDLDGPWGQGTREVVDLVYEEEVIAILGAHHGRNAHLVEQVIARTQVPFISAWASDPTLSQAFVPWYFSCAPNSRTQATAFHREVWQGNGYRRLLLVSDASYDANLDREHFLKTLSEEERSGVALLDVSTRTNEQVAFPTKDFDAILLFGEPSTLAQVFDPLRAAYGDLPFYGTFTMLGEGAFDLLRGKDLNYLEVLGSGQWMKQIHHPWHQGFVQKFNRFPGATAAYAHDAMQLLLEAVIRSDADHSRLLSQISKTDYVGLTGAISFDDMGNRRGEPNLLRFLPKK